MRARIRVLLLAGFATLTISSQAQSYPALMLHDGQQATPLSESQSISGSTASQQAAIVQFATLPSTEQRHQLEAKGITFSDYVPHNAYLIRHSGLGSLSELFKGHTVRFFDYTPHLKLHKDLREGGLLPHAVDPQGNYIIDVVCYDTHGLLELQSQAGMKGWIVESRNEARNTMRVHIAQAAVYEMAALDVVKWMEPIPPPGEPEDTRGRSLHRSNGLDADYGAGRHYDGAGIKGCINDDGIVGPHIDFKGRLDQSTMATDGGNHGDMTTGIMTGAGNLDPTMKGMAYGSFVHVLNYNAAMPNTVGLYLSDTVTITSTSYSNGCNVGYTSTARAIDQEIRTYPEILQFFSGGNNGTSNCGYETSGAAWGNITGGHKSAKNVIAVANLYADDSREVSSSRGPATDGRLKPDLSANGQGQNSTDTDNTYQVGGGTSAASPGAAGVAMQLSQAYKALYGTLPKGAILKLIMQNTADDLGNAGPDFSFGWGRINGVRAVKVLEENRLLNDNINTGVTKNHNITVPANVAELRVMVYWPDREGSTIAAKALVNNLDITLSTPSAVTMYPQVLNPTPIASLLDDPSVPGVDTLNNTEQVVMLNPAAGTYTLNVIGTEVPFGPQDYYVTWEFLYDSVVVTYPLGGEGFVPGETERIRWDAYGTTGGTFTVEYSTNNGTSWSTLSSSVAASARFYNWAVPSLPTGQALVRVSRAGKSGVSPANFSISPLPSNLDIDWVCPDSFQVSWIGTASATGYDVYLLGTNYMEIVGSTTGTSFVITGVSPSTSAWVSVRATGPAGLASRRANAIERPAGVFGCVVSEDAGISQALSPPDGAIPSCMITGPVPVSVEITNYGVNPLTGVQVSYSLNGGVPVTETVAGTIAPGVAATHSFATSITISGSLQDLVIWTTYATDGNLYNDTIAYSFESVTGTLISSLTWDEDFESMALCGTASDCGTTICNLTGGVVNTESGLHDDHDWRVDQDDTPSASTGPAVDHTLGTTAGNYIYLEASNGCFEKQATLLTPCFDLSSGATTPEFTFWYHMYGANMGTLHVDVMGNDLVWDLDVITPISGDQGNMWFSRTINLVPYIGGKAAVRFRGITGEDYASDMALDDLIYDKGSVSVAGNVQQWGIQLYPNPAAGQATLTLTNVKGSNFTAEILNPLMQPVQTHLVGLNGGEGELQFDLRSLPAGVYFVRVSANNQVLVRKLEVMR